MDQPLSKRYAIVVAFILWMVFGNDWLVATGQDFVTQVAPILQQHCLRCHSDQVREGEVSFSSRASFVQSGVSAASSVNDHRLIAAITPDQVGHAEMPKDASPLAEHERRLLADWVKAGTHWPDDFTINAPAIANLDWWSLRPIAASTAFDAKLRDKLNRNVVDQFIDESLAANQLTAAPQADAAACFADSLMTLPACHHRPKI